MRVGEERDRPWPGGHQRGQRQPILPAPLPGEQVGLPGEQVEDPAAVVRVEGGEKAEESGGGRGEVRGSDVIAEALVQLRPRARAPRPQVVHQRSLEKSSPGGAKVTPAGGGN
ncbi:hypothetical protein BGM09_08290 [Streptomyces sp. CBMA29]|nr:hypothetical protein [Streptomyces sp. CBMA29]